MAVTAPPDYSTFLAWVRASGVTTEPKLQRALADAPDADSARAVADRLVAGGVLTRYQAERLLAGRRDGFVLGPYVITDHLGRSDTGRVFKARHRTMNRLVAINVLASRLTAADDVREAVRAEARAAARLVHPNLLTLLDVNQSGGRMYLVTEYLAGPSVAQVLRESARLPPAQAGDIVRQAALGLQHAHETGVTHGRLSPAAVLLGLPGRGGAERPLVKVSGLGLGRFAVAAGGAGGEPSYRPPEAQAGLAAATPAADVYALGCLFYHLLAGQPPRPAAAPGQMILPIGYVRPDVPGGAAALLADMLGDDSEARPTAEQVAARLAACGDTGNGAAVELNLPPAVTYSPAASILESTACAPRPSGDTSPFDGLTRADDAGDRTPVTVRARATRRTARAFPVAAAVVLLLSAAAVAAALALLVRQALAGR